MFFDFFKKFKTKTLLIIAGFLVPICFVGLIFWLRAYFLVGRDSFFLVAPAKTEVYWHSSFPRGADDLWLLAFSKKILAEQAALEAEFLFTKVGQVSSEVSLAILPGHEDFIFWGKVEAGKFDEIKESLETEKFNYIFENDGRVTITNTRIALSELLAVLDGRAGTLSSNKVRLIAWNIANRRLPAQIYLKNNFKFKDLSAVNWHSDFWERNILSVDLKLSSTEPHNLSDFLWRITADNSYLFRNAEDLIKNNLAMALPEKRDYILPDKTIVQEMLVNPALFSFSKQTLVGEEVDYLGVPSLDQDFLVVRKSDDIVISNSSEEIVDYLTGLSPRPDYYGKNLVELSLDWLKWVTTDFGGIVFGVKVR